MKAKKLVQCLLLTFLIEDLLSLSTVLLEHTKIYKILIYNELGAVETLRPQKVLQIGQKG